MITDPAASEINVPFTIVNDTRMDIPAVIFTLTGLHAVTLVSDAGQVRENVHVESPPAPRLGGLFADSVMYYYFVDPYSDGRDDDAVESPYTGRTMVSVRTEMPAISSFTQMDAQLKVPLDTTLKSHVIDILNITGQADGHLPGPPPGGGTLGNIQQKGQVAYREVLTIEGAEDENGTRINSDMVACHLEIHVEANRTGFYAVGFNNYINIAVFGESTQVYDHPASGFVYSTEPVPLSSLQLKLSGNPHAGTSISPDTTPFPEGSHIFVESSDSFLLPLTGRVIFYPKSRSGTGFGDTYVIMAGTLIGSANPSTYTHSYNATYRLVCDDPNVKLIYKK